MLLEAQGQIEKAKHFYQLVLNSKLCVECISDAKAEPAWIEIDEFCAQRPIRTLTALALKNYALLLKKEIHNQLVQQKAIQLLEDVFIYLFVYLFIYLLVLYV